MTMDHWCTPPAVADPLEAFFRGPVACDPCSNSRSIIKAVTTYTAGGLHLPWGRTTYRNEPYSRLEPWTDKSILEIDAGNVVELVGLEPVATSTRWWRKTTGLEPVLVPHPTRKNRMREVFAPRGTHMFTKRINFINERGVVMKGVRHDSVLTYYGPRRTAFKKAFRALESWTVG